MATTIDTRTKLNLGSGRQYNPEAVNLDITPDTSPDVVHDLNETPWPFPDQRFANIEAIDVIEHLDRPLDALREIHRVLKPGGTVLIVVPHFSSANAHHRPDTPDQLRIPELRLRNRRAPPRLLHARTIPDGQPSRVLQARTRQPARQPRGEQVA